MHLFQLVQVLILLLLKDVNSFQIRAHNVLPTTQQPPDVSTTQQPSVVSTTQQPPVVSTTPAVDNQQISDQAVTLDNRNDDATTVASTTQDASVNNQQTTDQTVNSNDSNGDKTTVASTTQGSLVNNQQTTDQTVNSNGNNDDKNSDVSTTQQPPVDNQQNTDSLNKTEDSLQPKSAEGLDQTFPKNCQEIKKSGITTSGIYRIKPEHAPECFLVACEMETREGGWAYLLNRFNGYQNFFLEWNDYKFGFGNLLGEFWMGLEHLYQLTGCEVNELLVELVDWNSKKLYAHYTAFSIGSEDEGYALRLLGGYSGDAGDSLERHAGGKFSTKDKDQDNWEKGSCANQYMGAWWYRSCMDSQLTGVYEIKDTHQSVFWQGFNGNANSLKEVRMMVRPSLNNSAAIKLHG